MLKNRIFSLLLTATVLVFCFKMFQIIRLYTVAEPDTTFLRSRADQINWPQYRWALYAHIFPALLILATGMTQFSAYILRRAVVVHRVLGQVYVQLVLWLSAPAALVMSFYAAGGWFTKAAFLCQSICWWFCTFWAWRAIRNRSIQVHGIWMVRSYAICAGAITLRLMQLLFHLQGQMLPGDSYRLVAWPSWLLNLALAELLLAIYAYRRKLRPA
ncbi:MAG: DUF2306 domain-containing protein [Bacteroidota bacterium]